VTYATLCQNCGEWQHPSSGGDCLNQCVKDGLATKPSKVNVPGREDELCVHDDLDFEAARRGPLIALCRDCGSELEEIPVGAASRWDMLKEVYRLRLEEQARIVAARIAARGGRG